MAARRHSWILLLLLLSTLLCLQLDVCDASIGRQGALWVIRRQRENPDDWDRFSDRDAGKGIQQTELDGCIVWNEHNTVFGSKSSQLHHFFLFVAV